MASAQAADVEIRYLVERAPLRALPAATQVIIELHADADCDAAVASESIALADIESIVDIPRVRLRGAPRLPRIVELRRTVTGLPAVTAVYAAVHADGIVPVAEPCQVQALAPPSPMPRPIVRDARGATIGVVSRIGRERYGVLVDEGRGVAYGIGIGRSTFVAFESGQLFSTLDCSGAPLLQLYEYPYVMAADATDGLIYGPTGPPTLVPLRSFLGNYGCLETGREAYAVPAMPLDLERFIPPFIVDHVPQTH